MPAHVSCVAHHIFTRQGVALTGRLSSLQGCIDEVIMHSKPESLNAAPDSLVGANSSLPTSEPAWNLTVDLQGTITVEMVSMTASECTLCKQTCAKMCCRDVARHIATRMHASVHYVG